MKIFAPCLLLVLIFVFPAQADDKNKSPGMTQNEKKSSKLEIIGAKELVDKLILPAVRKQILAESKFWYLDAKKLLRKSFKNYPTQPQKDSPALAGAD